MTRHTTIRKSELDNKTIRLFEPGCYTAGVPMTADMAYAVLSLAFAELYKRQCGEGDLNACSPGLSDDALRRLALLMDRAITGISVLRDTPQRAKR